MGPLLSKKPQRKVNKELFLNLKRNKIKDLIECIEIIDENYHQVVFLRYEEFDDIFGPLLPDTEVLFDMLSEKTPKGERIVDIYESLCCFILFSSAEFEQKAAFIFRLFDFDASATIEPQELVLTMQSVVRALCKIANLSIPTLSYLESLAKTCFSLIDSDRSKHIEFSEFIRWVYENDEFQDFLLSYSSTQTFQNAKRRMKDLMIHYDAKFETMCMKPGQDSVDLNQIMTSFKEEFLDFNPAYVEFLWDIMVTSTRINNANEDEKRKLIKELSKTNETGKTRQRAKSDISKYGNVLIPRNIFLDVLRAWAAFSATDINNDNVLSIHELKVMLWVFEDEEPNEFRVRSEMMEIDKDNTETIDRMEWLAHLCSEDEKTGHQVFRSQIRATFKKYDTDNSGTLSIRELRELLRDTFRDYILKTKDEESAFNLKMMIEELAREIMDELNQDVDYSLNWSEFKLFIDKSMTKQEKLRKFLDLALV